MPSPFDRAATTAASALAAVFGERLRVVPMQRSRYGAAVPDPQRMPREVRGSVFVTADHLEVTEEGSLGRDFRHQIATSAMVVSIELVQLAGFTPVAGDRFVRLDQPDAKDLEVIVQRPPMLAAARFVVVEVDAVVQDDTP